jgi:hypothetical protein
MTVDIKQIESLPVVLPPAPWKVVGDFTVGGLMAIGYASQTDYLLAVSSQGRGLFDGVHGEKLSRDPNTSNHWLNAIKLTALGIAPIMDEPIRLAGIFGGGLPLTTHDGWSIETIESPWTQTHVFLCKPYTSLFQNIENGFKVAADDVCEFRAVGFSETGNSFAVATSCSLTLFGRVI